jgi:hypothetical protein
MPASNAAATANLPIRETQFKVIICSRAQKPEAYRLRILEFRACKSNRRKIAKASHRGFTGRHSHTSKILRGG